MAINFSGIVGNLASLGFYDFVLPWLLFFAVILGVLNAVKIFGENSRVNAIIAAVLAFFIVAYTPIGTSMGAFLVTMFGVGGMFIAALLLLLLLVGVLGFNLKNAFGSDGKPNWGLILVILVLLLLVAWIFSTVTGTGIGLSIPGLDSATWTIIFVIVFVLLVIYWATCGASCTATGGKGKSE